MDILRRTMLLFESLVERIRSIGGLLMTSGTSTGVDSSRKVFTGFWIFNF